MLQMSTYSKAGHSQWHQEHEVSRRCLKDREALPLERKNTAFLLVPAPATWVSTCLTATVTLGMSWLLPNPTGSFQPSRRNDGNGRREQRDHTGQIRPWQRCVCDPLFAVTWQATPIPSHMGPLEFSGSKKVETYVFGSHLYSDAYNYGM